MKRWRVLYSTRVCKGNAKIAIQAMQIVPKRAPMKGNEVKRYADGND